MEELTVASELQQLLFGLFQEHIFSIEGKVMPSQEEDGIPEEFIAKSLLIDKAISLLNLFGEQVNEMGLQRPD